jgi:subtilisin family serine protease
MSLGGPPGEAPDLGTSNAIADARAAGVAVICASGNDGANQISQPGADSRSVAVGAFGRKGLFPSNTVSSERVGKLGAPDRKNFMANFSNNGFELDMVGPGVGVVSTVPEGYAVMDGTSMASPAVTGAVARLLSVSPVLNMPRNQARSDAILKLAYTSAKLLGFGQEHEGHGWIK